MGYTHYMSFKKDNSVTTNKKYQYAVRQCQKVIKGYNDNVKSIDKKHQDRLSGYSAHCKVGDYLGINFNGVGDLSHESFELRDYYKNNRDFEFCKTAEKPYDVVVVACLIVLNHYLGDNIQVSSDGKTYDWFDGLELASSILGLKLLKIPKSIESRLFIVKGA